MLSELKGLAADGGLFLGEATSDVCAEYWWWGSLKRAPLGEAPEQAHRLARRSMIIESG